MCIHTHSFTELIFLFQQGFRLKISLIVYYQNAGQHHLCCRLMIFDMTYYMTVFIWKKGFPFHAGIQTVCEVRKYWWWEEVIAVFLMLILKCISPLSGFLWCSLHWHGNMKFSRKFSKCPKTTGSDRPLEGVKTITAIIAAVQWCFGQFDNRMFDLAVSLDFKIDLAAKACCKIWRFGRVFI